MAATCQTASDGAGSAVSVRCPAIPAPARVAGVQRMATNAVHRPHPGVRRDAASVVPRHWCPAWQATPVPAVAWLSCPASSVLVASRPAAAGSSRCVPTAAAGPARDRQPAHPTASAGRHRNHCDVLEARASPAATNATRPSVWSRRPPVRTWPAWPARCVAHTRARPPGTHHRTAMSLA